MPLIDRLKSELDRAGRAAQGALDEGRLRLDLFRARQTADRSAQRLGYAVFRARRADDELTIEQYAVLAADLTAAEAEVSRYETLVAEAESRRKNTSTLPARID